MAPVQRQTPLQQARTDVRMQRAAVKRSKDAVAEAERLSKGNAWLQGHRDHLADEQASLEGFKAILKELEAS